MVKTVWDDFPTRREQDEDARIDGEHAVAEEAKEAHYAYEVATGDAGWILGLEPLCTHFDSMSYGAGYCDECWDLSQPKLAPMG